LAAASADDGWLLRDIMLLRLRALLAQARGEFVDYRDLVARYRAVDLRLRPAAQDDGAVGSAAVGERMPEADAHGQHRDQHRDDAGNTDDDDARGADALRQRLQTHDAHGPELFEHAAFLSACQPAHRRC